MLEATRSLREFTSAATRETYLGNRVLQLAVERQLQVIGEAARHLSEGFRQAHPEVPWRSIIGLRNIVVHPYAEVDQERLWHVVASDIPELITRLEPLIPPLPPDVD